jgi:mono/diheme cytochrome c family protein
MADEDPGFLTHLSRAVVWLSLVVFLTGLAAAGYFAWRLSRDAAETFADPVDQFKYGSTGGDRNFGIPYAMWEAMPTLFRDLMPEGREDEGWAAFGFLYEDPADLPPELRHPRPVGTSLRNNLGIDRIFLNCAGCHAGSVRTGPGGEQLIVAGMPSNTVDLSAFQGFLARAAVDERFSADRFLSEIDAQGIELDLVNRFALKFVGIGMARERLLAIVDRFDDFVHNEPTFGPGRFDTFNPAKALLNWEFDQIPEAERIGVVDFPSVFLQGPKEGMQLHWDGNNTKVSERNRSAAFGTGATPPILDRASLKRMEDWLATAEPPAFADVFPAQFDAALAEQGAPIYARECAACHGASGRDFSGEYVGQVTPIAEVGTDRARLDNYTQDLAVNQNSLYAEFGTERFQTFRKTNGYANAPLDGLWLRAPYLHNGSVPTLVALLSPPDERPAAFLRGHDVYDPQAMGFESDPARIDPAVQPHLFCYVTRAGADALCPAAVPPMNGTCDAGICRGNGNGGHLWGTDLDPADKRALIEHLKTF